MKRVILKSDLITLFVILISSIKGYSIENMSQPGVENVSLGNTSFAHYPAYSVLHKLTASGIAVTGIPLNADYTFRCPQTSGLLSFLLKLLNNIK